MTKAPSLPDVAVREDAATAVVPPDVFVDPMLTVDPLMTMEPEMRRSPDEAVAGRSSRFAPAIGALVSRESTRPSTLAVETCCAAVAATHAVARQRIKSGRTVSLDGPIRRRPYCPAKPRWANGNMASRLQRSDPGNGTAGSGQESSQ